MTVTLPILNVKRLNNLGIGKIECQAGAIAFGLVRVVRSPFGHWQSQSLFYPIVSTAFGNYLKGMLTSDSEEQLQNRSQLDPGESEAIALALEIKTDLLLIDERR